MHYDYVVVLKKSSGRQIDFISIFLCILSIVGFVYNQISTTQFSFPFTLISVIIANGIGYNIFFVKKGKSPRYKYLLFLAGIAWIVMPHLQWISIAFFFLAFLEYQAKHPLEVGFTDDEILINTLIKRKFVWSDFNNIILKEGLLTLDFKNNTLFQKEALDDDEPDADEDEFNDYCNARLMKANSRNCIIASQ
jgi:hypothetical protein